MRDDVLTILNEREPLKQQMAVELETHLKARGLLCARLKPTKNLAQIIRERNPRILVLDYVLGDVATALDVLAELDAEKSDSITSTIIWTDEPSVSVAVNAMKLGAVDYIELGAPNSLEKALDAIDRTRKLSPLPKTSRPTRRAVDFEEPVGQERSFLNCLSLCSSLASRNFPVVVIQGPSGAGRNTLARYVHQKRAHPGSIFEIDVDIWPNDLLTIYGGRDFRGVPLLSHAATVVVDHAEFDTGELLEGIAKNRELIWSDPKNEAGPMLIVGTTSVEIANSWRKTVGAEVIEVPGLSERHDDFLPLIQRFLHSTQGFSSVNKVKFSPELLEQLAKLPWPANVRELRAAIIEAATTPLDSVVLEETTEKLPGLSVDNRLLLQAVLNAKDRWRRFQELSAQVPEAPLARRALDESLGNYRIAAVRLGTGVPQLRAALTGGQ